MFRQLVFLYWQNIATFWNVSTKTGLDNPFIL